MAENTFLIVVNDAVATGVTLIEDHDLSMTKDKKQEEYLLRLISRH